MRSTVGSAFACFGPEDGLGAVALWGRHTPADVDPLFAAVNVLAASGLERLLIDTRGLSSGAPDPAAFERATHFLPGAWRRAAPTLRKAALLLGPRLQGALIAGTLHLLDGSVSLHPFRDVQKAAQFLGVPSSLLASIDAVREVPRLVSDLRKLLDTSRGTLRLAPAAQRLGQSVRSLQRHLSEAGTSFRGEAEAARLRAAEELLCSTDLKIAAIANEVGCASPQHFSALFRRARGITPQQFRLNRPV